MNASYFSSSAQLSEPNTSVYISASLRMVGLVTWVKKRFLRKIPLLSLIALIDAYIYRLLVPLPDYVSMLPVIFVAARRICLS